MLVNSYTKQIDTSVMIDQKLYQRFICQMVNHVIKLRHHLLVGIQLLHMVSTDQRNQGRHPFLILLEH